MILITKTKIGKVNKGRGVKERSGEEKEKKREVYPGTSPLV